MLIHLGIILLNKGAVRLILLHFLVKSRPL